MEMVADRVKKTRDETWEAKNPHEWHPLTRTMGIAHLGWERWEAASVPRC
jgi:formate dehydrogenase major subunit